MSLLSESKVILDALKIELEKEIYKGIEIRYKKTNKKVPKKVETAIKRMLKKHNFVGLLNKEMLKYD